MYAKKVVSLHSKYNAKPIAHWQLDIIMATINRNIIRTRALVLSILITLLSASVRAESVYRDTCYSLRADMTYAYNIVYGHHGAFDVDAILPINPHFEGEVAARATTANTYAIGFRAQPKFPIRKNGIDYGEVVLETRVLYNRYERNQIHGLSIAFSAGYRWEYIYFKAGYGLSMAATTVMSQHSTENSVFEPHNLVYYLEIFARPHTSPWNISACITDMTDFQMERMFTPIFMLKSYVDIAEHWRLCFSGQCKPVGIANQAASFFGAEVTVGGLYKF